MMRLVRSLMLTAVALMLAGPAVADTNAQFVFAGIEAPQADNIDNFRFSLCAMPLVNRILRTWNLASCTTFTPSVAKFCSS